VGDDHPEPRRRKKRRQLDGTGTVSRRTEERTTEQINWLLGELGKDEEWARFKSQQGKVLLDNEIPDYWGFAVDIIDKYWYRSPNKITVSSFVDFLSFLLLYSVSNLLQGTRKISKNAIYAALGVEETWLRNVETGFELLEKHQNHEDIAVLLTPESDSRTGQGHLLQLLKRIDDE
jgi:hypothetical protein